MKKYLILVALSGLIICVDQLTKIYIHMNFAEGDSISVINNFFNITYVQNPGAAFGFLRDAQETLRNAFFLTIPPIAAVIILLMLRTIPQNQTVTILALSSLFGGAIGNYIDRLWHGYVVDFLDFHYYHIAAWPAFNVADMAIVIGISVMVIIELKNMWQEHQQKKLSANN